MDSGSSDTRHFTHSRDNVVQWYTGFLQKVLTVLSEKKARTIECCTFHGGINDCIEDDPAGYGFFSMMDFGASPPGCVTSVLKGKHGTIMNENVWVGARYYPLPIHHSESFLEVFYGCVISENVTSLNNGVLGNDIRLNPIYDHRVFSV
jgi:hypothetical protein